MCTNFSTRNRAVIMNNYSVQTLLLDRNAYCPCGPNRQDYSRRSRLYNPDPKYACHSDLTCHQFDSIPKDQSCGQYGAPQFNCCGGGPPATTIPCTSGGGCYPPGDIDDCQLPPQPSCQRRRIRPPACCKSGSTYKDLIQSMQCCMPPVCCPCPPSCCPCPPPCCPSAEEEEMCDEDNEDEEQSCQPESCYSLEVPPEMGDCCGSKVTYNFGPTGITRSIQTRGGNQVCMPCQDDSVTLETYGGPGGCCVGNSGIRVESKCKSFSCCAPPPPCCPPPTCRPVLRCQPSCCPRPCPPPPCRNRRRVRCSPFLRTTVGPDIGCGCMSMEFRPRFRNP